MSLFAISRGEFSNPLISSSVVRRPSSFVEAIRYFYPLDLLFIQSHFLSLRKSL